MLELKNVKVDSMNPDYMELSWEIKSTPDNIFKYQYTILRSEGEHGPYEVLAGPFVDRYRFTDYIAPMKKHWRRLFYKIRIEHIDTNETEEFGPYSATHRLSLDALEMIRNEQLLFKRFIGRPCVLLPVRTFGQRCGECWDKITQQRLVSHCHACYNTGFTLGYMQPTIVYTHIFPETQNQLNNPVTVTEDTQARAQMSIFPYVKPRDVVVEANNKRWRVQSVSTTQRLRADVRQELILTLLPKGDIEYAIDVSIPEVAETEELTYMPRTTIQ